jgi:hypothetical protein
VSPNSAETSRTPAVCHSRRSFLVKAGLGALGSLLAPLRSEPQVPAVVLTVGLDLGEALYKKGIDYAAGTLLQTIFKESKPVDAREFINEAVTGIEAKIAGLEAKIDQQNLYRMQSELGSISSTFAEYVALLDQGEGDKSLLDFCDTTSAGLLLFSMRYDQAFFLSTAVLAYRLLTRFALFQFDRSSGRSGEGRITSLVTNGDMKSYFQGLIQSRARLMKSLTPQYAISCNRHQELLPFATPKTECDILRANVPISKTNVMSWGSESDQSAQHIFDKTNHIALAYVYNLPTYKSDRGTWTSVTQKSREQILLGADCMDRMYYAAKRAPCPPQLDRRSLIEFSALTALNCQTEGSANWRCKVPEYRVLQFGGVSK